MGNVFRGRNRKIGMLALGLACLFAILWARSEVVPEMLVVFDPWGCGYRLTSSYGTLGYLRGSHMSVDAKSFWEPIEFHLERSSLEVPHWAIVVPLTILSAWLIVQKPNFKSNGLTVFIT